MRFCDGSDKGKASNIEKASETRDEGLAMIRSVQGRKHELYTESPNSPRPKNTRHVKSKVKNMLFEIKGILL
jgi:hypothetical protein